MAIKKLVLDDFLEEETFSLIGIHCTIEDYRLAYLLNKNLELQLKRLENDIDDNNVGVAFSIFEWHDEAAFKTWNLVSNTCKVVTDQLEEHSNSLFSATETVTKTHHLVPEFKKANYLLKIDNECLTNNDKLILEKILKIDQVITAYSINQDALKFKDRLLFN